MDDKIKKAIDNIDNNKEDKAKHINEDKKSDLILFEMDKEDILKMQKKEEKTIRDTRMNSWICITNTKKSMMPERSGI